MKHLKTLLSTEFFFVMFLFSGTFKESINFPFDLAALFLFLATIGSIKRVFRNPIFKKWIFLPLFLYGGLFAIMLLSFLFTAYTDDALNKIIKFVGLTLPAILLPLAFIKGKESLEKILFSIAALSTVLSVISLPMVLNPENFFIGFNNGNYMLLARLTGLGFIVLCYFSFVSKGKNKLVAITSTILSAIVLLSTGSRMPLIAVALSSLYLISRIFTKVNGKIHIRKKALYIIAAATFLLFSIRQLLSLGFFNTIAIRFADFLDTSGGASVSARVQRYQTSFDIFNENPIFGSGIGNFGLYYESLYGGIYAHNIFLEMMSELGVLGIIWILIFMAVVSLSIFNLSGSYPLSLRITFIIGFFYSFMNAMVSGDINDNRSLFFFTIILLYMTFEKGYISREVKSKNLKLQTSQ